MPIDKRNGCFSLILSALFIPGNLQAQDHATELAKKTQNPVADLISLPFQNNISGTIPPYGRISNNLNIQPVVPMKLGGGVNMILRNILPVNSIPSGRDRSVWGFGDMTTTLFFTPAKSGKIIWGAGPALQWNTSTHPELGSGKWALGPGAVVLKMTGRWVYGGLFQNLWSVGGDEKRDDINAMLVQPFVNYNFNKGWALGYSPFITANWKNPAGRNWTIPVGLQISRTFVLGHQPMSAALGYYYNAIGPTGTPHWQVRVSYSLLFPE